MAGFKLGIYVVWYDELVLGEISWTAGNDQLQTKILFAHRGALVWTLYASTTIPYISLFISCRMSTTETMDLIADDDIDTETLQAQINMSMSFAEDLVSSWIQPAHKANLSKGAVDAQKLLDEQLRRPPRCVIV